MKLIFLIFIDNLFFSLCPVYALTHNDTMVALFYMRTSFFCLSHVFEIFPKSFNFFNLYISIPCLGVLQVAPLGFVVLSLFPHPFAIHPVKGVGGGLSTWESHPDALPFPKSSLPNSLVSWVHPPPRFVLSQTLGTELWEHCSPVNGMAEGWGLWNRVLILGFPAFRVSGT